MIGELPYKFSMFRPFPTQARSSHDGYEFVVYMTPNVAGYRNGESLHNQLVFAAPARGDDDGYVFTMTVGLIEGLDVFDVVRNYQDIFLDRYQQYLVSGRI